MQDTLVLFDIDGTLIHSGGCGRAAIRLALHDIFGTVGRLDEVDFAGKTDWQIMLEALETAGIPVPLIETRMPAYNISAAEHLAAIIHTFPVRPCVGGPEVVAALKADPSVLVGLVTGNMEALVPLKLQAAGYNPADFEIGAYGSEGWVRSMLPPIALERARSYSGVNFAPDRIVIIGDTPDDITCAASVGARTVAVATGPFTTDQLRTYRPDHVFESMADREAVLAAILRDGHAA